MLGADYANLLRGSTFVLGAIIGSFLNVCIYRLPRGLSVYSPRRSFCPHCQYQIPAWQNIPILGWLFLRGQCANCKKRISIRYPLIEFLTAIAFLCLWEHTHSLAFLPYAIFVSFLIVGAFIDFEFLIIPDSITIGGALVGMICSYFFPIIMQETHRVAALIWSITGAAIGYGILFMVAELGKLAFGKKRIAYEAPLPFTWKRIAFADLPKAEQEKYEREGLEKTGFDAQLFLEGEPDYWSDFFNRETDRLVLFCETLKFKDKSYENVSLDCFYDHFVLENVVYPLDTISNFEGILKEFTFPREAMGLGDVKLMACIGAFIGWKGVLFTITVASALGSIIGILLLLIAPKTLSAQIPFGPYLAAGALVWIFFGPQWINAYLYLLTL